MSINKDSQKAPNLRFKGFTDDWEQRRFMDLLDDTDGIRRGPFGSALKKDLFVSESDYVIYEQQNAIYDHFDTRYNISKEKFDELHSFKLETGDFIMSGAGTIGRISRVPKGIKPGVFNQALIRFRIKNEVTDSDYFLQWIRSDNMQRKFTNANPGSAMTNLVPLSEVKGWGVIVPLKEEQRLLGKFLTALDNNITLHQRKLDQLNQLKEALLQQMFPGKGETVPKLRFAGFEGDWEERKLGDLFIKGGSGGTPKSTNKDFYDGNIPFLGISDITKSNGFINNTEKHISVDGLNNSAAWVVPRGAISLAMYASVGKVAVLNIDAATSQAFYNMVFDDDDLRDFVYQCLIKANELSEWNKLISTGTQANLNADKVKNFMLYLPQNHAEIKLISAFLKQFDTTIAIQQRKLDQLQNMKQVLLQNMFI